MAALLGVLVGLALGLTGGGGSILAVPMLVYGVGLSARDAVSISLITVAASAALGTLGAFRARLVEVRAGAVFAAGGVLAAPLGVKWSRLLPEETILVTFAVLMVAVALLMWARASRDPAGAAVVRAAFVSVGADAAGPVCRLSSDQRLRLNAPCTAVLAGSGLATGILSGFFGVGGGFVVVPALTVVTQLDIHRAVATSLFVITVVSLTAVGSLLAIGERVPLDLAWRFGGGALAGMLLGRVVARRVAGASLQKTFAVVILVVGGVMIADRLS